MKAVEYKNKKEEKEFDKFIKRTISKQLHILENTKINALDKEFDKLFKKGIQKLLPF